MTESIRHMTNHAGTSIYIFRLMPYYLDGVSACVDVIHHNYQ